MGNYHAFYTVHLEYMFKLTRIPLRIQKCFDSMYIYLCNMNIACVRTVGVADEGSRQHNKDGQCPLHIDDVVWRHRCQFLPIKNIKHSYGCFFKQINSNTVCQMFRSCTQTRHNPHSVARCLFGLVYNSFTF